MGGAVERLYIFLHTRVRVCEYLKELLYCSTCSTRVPSGIKFRVREAFIVFFRFYLCMSKKSSTFARKKKVPTQKAYHHETPAINPIVLFGVIPSYLQATRIISPIQYIHYLPYGEI